MEITVLIQPLPDRGYRASTGEPLAAVAEGPTREEALQNLKALVGQRARDGAEVVTLHVPVAPLQTDPLWPNDDITRAWLDGIAEYRQQREQQPDPWEVPPGSAS